MPVVDINNKALEEIARRVLPGTGQSSLDRTRSGTSTPVYRIRRGGATLYVRLAEAHDGNLAPEVLVHDALRASGVRVPEVVHFESFNEALGRSMMVTTEAPGFSLAEHHRHIDTRQVLRAAGQDLAAINQLPVDGFGWICRNRPDATRLAAEQSSLRAFALGDLDASLAALPPFLSTDETTAIRRVIAGHDVWLAAEQANLAHGDFDVTHIYHQDGEYTGIIDFGEVRGTDSFYDLGHFALHDGEKIASTLLLRLMAGYRDVVAIPAEGEARIAFWALLIGLRALARTAKRQIPACHDHLMHGIRRSMAALLT